MPRKTKADELIAHDRASVRHPDLRCLTCGGPALLSVVTLDAWGRRMPVEKHVQQWSCARGRCAPAEVVLRGGALEVRS